MLIKNVVTGLISILEDKRLQVREDTIILEDDVEISRTYHRYMVSPGDDVSTKAQIVQDIAGLLWTPEAIAEWKIKEEKIRGVPGSGVPAITQIDPPHTPVPII